MAKKTNNYYWHYAHSSGHGKDRESWDAHNDGVFSSALFAAWDAKDKGYPEADVYRSTPRGSQKDFRRASDIIQAHIEAKCPFKLEQEVLTISEYGDIRAGKVVKVEEHCLEVDVDSRYGYVLRFHISNVSMNTQDGWRAMRERAIGYKHALIAKLTEQHQIALSRAQSEIKKLERQLKRDAKQKVK
jgi:hypothetical protein